MKGDERTWAYQKWDEIRTSYADQEHHIICHHTMQYYSLYTIEYIWKYISEIESHICHRMPFEMMLHIRYHKSIRCGTSDLAGSMRSHQDQSCHTQVSSLHCYSSDQSLPCMPTHEISRDQSCHTQVSSLYAYSWDQSCHTKVCHDTM